MFRELSESDRKYRPSFSGWPPFSRTPVVAFIRHPAWSRSAAVRVASYLYLSHILASYPRTFGVRGLHAGLNTPFHTVWLMAFLSTAHSTAWRTFMSSSGGFSTFIISEWPEPAWIGS